MNPTHLAQYEAAQAAKLANTGTKKPETNTTHYNVRAFIAWSAFGLALLAVGWFIWFNTFQSNYPINITLLSIPYCFAGLALTLSLRKAIQTGHDFHAGLYAVGLGVLCGLM